MLSNRVWFVTIFGDPLEMKLFLNISVVNYGLNAFDYIFFSRAMEFLNQCELLKIEDILPFFQDFVTIDHFKVRLTAFGIVAITQVLLRK